MAVLIILLVSSRNISLQYLKQPATVSSCLRGATQKFGEFTQGTRTGCPTPFRR